MPFAISSVETQVLHDERFSSRGITVSVLRLDKLHPVVSGNKLFKLDLFLTAAARTGETRLLSFGGAYSNHLVATAYAGKESGLETFGVVRGEKPATLSPTLLECLAYGMQIHFISRQEYAVKETSAFRDALQERFGKFLLIPEGGYHPWGAAGAAGIRQWINGKGYTHICTATGTGTTLAGLLLDPEPGQSIIGIPALKGIDDWQERMSMLLGDASNLPALEILQGHHFGGYAKKNETLIAFMNDCWNKHGLPLDFVYTAKMMHAVYERTEQGHFPKGSRVLCLHTGGLQGNRSLPPGTLLY